MGLLAVVSGHSLAPDTGTAAVFRSVPVGHSAVTVLEADGYVILPRHGVGTSTLPHRIDHAAHARALAALGCDRVVGLGSVGSLHADLPVGSALVPDDFVALAQPAEGSFADERAHVVPGFDRPWRRRVLDAWIRHATGLAVRDGGVYWQVPGPRFETAAEIRFLAAHADVVGMTVGSECVAMCERGLPYAAVCFVDNLANGVGGGELTYDAFLAGLTESRSRVAAVLDAVARELGAGASP